MVYADIKQKLKIDGRWLIAPRVWVYSLISGVIFCIVHYEGLKNLFTIGLIDPRWHHIFIIPIISLLLIYVRRIPLSIIPLWKSWGGFLFALVGLAIYFVGTVYSSTMVMGIGMISELFGIAAFLCGWGAMQYLWIPIVYLIFAVKFTVLYNPIAEVYNTVITKISAIFINLLGMPLRLEADPHGYFMQLYEEGSKLASPINTGDVIWDIRSLYIITAVGAAIAFYRHRHLFNITIIILVCPFLAIIADTAYVTLVCLQTPGNASVYNNYTSVYGGFLFIIPAIVLLLVITRLTNRFRASKSFSNKQTSRL